MAEEAKNTESTENSGGSMKVIGIIVGVLILGVVAYLIINPGNKTEEVDQPVDEQSVMEAEKAAEAMEEKESMEEAAMEAEAMEDVTVVKARAEAIRPLLTTNGVKSLDLILVYVDQNPTAVLVQKTEYPEAVQDAIDEVQAEIADALATGISTKMNTKTIVLKTGETVDITVGEEYELNGILTEMDVSEEQQEAIDEEAAVTPLGTPFVLTMEDGSQLYFLFNEENTQAIMDDGLVGEDVDITVEVTEVDEETNTVTYQVVSGPTAAVETATE